MSLNIPDHPFPNDSISSAQTPPTNVSGASQTLTSSRDSLEAASTDRTGTYSVSRETQAPEISAPKTDTSVVNDFRVYLQAMRNYQDAVGASVKANLESRSKLSQLAVEQAAELYKLMEAKQKAMDQIEAEVRQKLDDLQKLFDEMKKAAEGQEEAIKKINESTKADYDALAKAYNDYIKNLKSIGAVEKDGKWEIPDKPESAMKDYNRFTEQYQSAVSKFNANAKTRSDAIDQYNKVTKAYNDKVTELNQKLNSFISNNDLAQYIRDLHLQIPQLPYASSYIPPDYYKEVKVPPYPITKVPTTIHIDPLPPPIAPVIIPNLPNFLPFQTAQLEGVMRTDLYNRRIASIDAAMAQCTNYWPFVMRQTLENIDRKLTEEEALLNSKLIAKRILSPSLQSASTSSIMMASIDMDNYHLQVIMGRALLQQAIRDANLKSLENISQEERDKRIEQFTNHLLVLAVGLLGSESLQSLFPGLGKISDALATLPKDSPAFAILFSISLANRIQEAINQGDTTKAIETFVNQNPELAALSPEDKEKLVAALNLGLALVAGKLMEDTTGLQGLVSQFLRSLLQSIISPHEVMEQVKIETQQTNTELHARVKDHFKSQGYSEDQAQLLADVGVNLTQHGLLTPHVTSNISDKTINPSVLEDSITAELVLSRHASPDEARATAREAISRTFVDAPYPSAEQFRSTLESHLTDLGIKNSADIAISAVLIPPAEPSLARTMPSSSVAPAALPRPSVTASAPISSPTSPTPTTITSSPSESTVTVAESPAIRPSSPPSPPLSPAELAPILQKRIVQLLSPQLGLQLAQEVGQEMNKSLFGTSNPDARDMAAIKSPYALVHVIQNQLYHLKDQQNQKWTEAVTETFKESIKTMESFYSFSLKIMDPAYLFVFAYGIIYGNPGKKKLQAIDIPI